MSDFSPKYVVGIDEAGRGPLAGPVAVGVVVMPADFYREYLERSAPTKNKIKSRPNVGIPTETSGEKEEIKFRIPIGRDSKKMSEKQREKWFNELVKDKKAGLLDYQVALVSNNNIDRLGIVPAISSGLSGCLTKLKLDPAECLVLLDGGLHAPTIFPNQQTIIQGDEKEAIIGLASVAAKVTRDHHMVKLAEKYPQYQFEKHKGYGTKLHFELILKHGLTPIHRRSFLKGVEN